jgi:predicted nucleotidyltransferase
MYPADELIPTVADFEKIITAKLSFEKAKATKDSAQFDAWCKSKGFRFTPWGIGYSLSKFYYSKSVANHKSKGSTTQPPKPTSNLALKYFVVGSILGWDELVAQLKTTIKKWGYTTQDLQQMAQDAWQNPNYTETILKALNDAQNGNNIQLVEAVEKHKTLNRKLFTTEDILKETVRKKMLEIVNEFVTNLQEQNIEIKIDDVLLVGSNANYNYTKDSDIDLHIIANTKKIKYEDDVANALYSAYRTLFNKNLDINIYNIPLELYIETENTPRNSNGVYSIKKDKWVKKPVHEEIPDYDKTALNKLVAKWEIKCQDTLDLVKADKLKDEKRVVKLLEDIYEKLRKTGIARSEYAIENLAFKELRNKGYLDKLKSAKHELISKRLSLEEKLDRQARIDAYNQLARAAGTQPIIQDNGLFFIYNLKASDVSRVLNNIRKLPFVSEAEANDSGKYDFSNTLALAMNNIPTKYYNIRGMINL